MGFSCKFSLQPICCIWAWSKICNWNHREMMVDWDGASHSRMIGHLWPQHFAFGPNFGSPPMWSFFPNRPVTDLKHRNSLWVPYGSNKQQGSCIFIHFRATYWRLMADPGESEEQQKLSSIERPEILLQWFNLSVEASRADVNGTSKKLGKGG